LERVDEELLDSMMSELEGALPPETARAFQEWRRRRTETKFFESVGRLWNPSDAPRPLTSVGGRAAVVAGLDVVLRGPTRASALLVGEHGVGKTAVLREVLAQLHREGWLVFEAGA